MLVVAPTPIGNLGDHTPRLIDHLQRADLIVAEDTRTAKKLIGALGVISHADFLALHEHNEREVLDRVLTRAATDLVVLVSDAGMPGISDPGFVLVRQAHQRGIVVSALPGPSAVVTALAASGLPTDRFCFDGFIPKKGKEAFLRERAREVRTMVFFESPHRLADTLEVMVGEWGGERMASVCRELSKLHEEVRTDTLDALAGHYAEGTKGEITIVVAGYSGESVSFEDAVAWAHKRVQAGEKATEVAKDIALETGHSKRELYSALLRADA